MQSNHDDGSSSAENDDALQTAEVTDVIQQLQCIQIEGEKELHEQKATVKELEWELEEAESDYVKALNDGSSKKAELAVLQFKFNEKDQELQKLSEKKHSFYGEIEALNEEMKKIKKEMEKNINDYVTAMSEVCQDYRKAAAFYTDSGLNEAIEKISSEILNMDFKADEEELIKVNAETESEAENIHPKHEMEIPLEQRRMVLKLFRNEKAAAKSELDVLSEKKSKLLEEIEKTQENLSLQSK